MLFEHLNVKDWLEHKTRQMEEEDRFSQKRSYHSGAYHRFFEGYSEIPIVNEDGKVSKIKRVYTGKLYLQRLDKPHRIAAKIEYPLLVILAGVLFFSAVTMKVPCNYIWWVSAVQACVFPSLLWLVTSVITYLLAKGEMKISEYRSGSRHLLYAAVLCAGFTLASVCLAILASCLNLYPFSRELVLYLTKLLLSAALFFTLRCLEAHIQYDISSNSVETPETAVEIS